MTANRKYVFVILFLIFILLGEAVVIAYLMNAASKEENQVSINPGILKKYMQSQANDYFNLISLCRKFTWNNFYIVDPYGKHVGNIFFVRSRDNVSYFICEFASNDTIGVFYARQIQGEIYGPIKILWIGKDPDLFRYLLIRSTLTNLVKSLTCCPDTYDYAQSLGRIECFYGYCKVESVPLLERIFEKYCDKTVFIKGPYQGDFYTYLKDWEGNYFGMRINFSVLDNKTYMFCVSLDWDYGFDDTYTAKAKLSYLNSLYKVEQLFKKAYTRKRRINLTVIVDVACKSGQCIINGTKIIGQ